MSAVFDFADRLTDETFALDPIEAVKAGIPTDRWPDWSPAGRGERLDWQRRRLSEVRRLEPVDEWDRLGVAVIEDDLEVALAAHDHGEDLRDLNSSWSPVQKVRDDFDLMPRGTAEDWARIATRLERIGDAFAGYRETLAEGISTGQVVAARQAVDVVAQLRAHGGAGRFFDQLAAEGAAHGLEGAVDAGRRAFDDMADWLEADYVPAADPVDGVGRDRYAFNVRRYLRTDSLDLEATYAWGWDEVHRIFGRMEEVAEQISPDGVGAAFEVLKTDPARAAHGTEAFVEFISSRLTDAQRRLSGTHFDIPEPLRRLDVQVAPPGGSLGAEYRSPSEDFSRPGAVVYHPGEKTVFPLYDEVSTAYHEGFPGHHLQDAMAVYLGDRLTRYHRLLSWTSGFGEGWALYAEHLMGELGFFEKPDYEMGLLANQVLRACRVVIDIGSHLQLAVPPNRFSVERWDYPTAVRVLEEVAFLEPDYARSEATRYLGWPGQAISYKVGERMILDLRERARQEPWYTDKEFHARAIGHGCVGLDLLEASVLG